MPTNKLTDTSAALGKSPFNRFAETLFAITSKVSPKAAPRLSAEMQEIQAEGARIKGLLDNSARNGLVSDALVLSLHDCHVAELAETHRQLGDVEAAYEASLKRLDAMFPEPPAPLPEPPAPKPAQRFPRLGDLLGERDQSSPLH